MAASSTTNKKEIVPGVMYVRPILTFQELHNSEGTVLTIPPRPENRRLFHGSEHLPFQFGLENYLSTNQRVDGSFVISDQLPFMLGSPHYLTNGKYRKLVVSGQPRDTTVLATAAVARTLFLHYLSEHPLQNIYTRAKQWLEQHVVQDINEVWHGLSELEACHEPGLQGESETLEVVLRACHTMGAIQEKSLFEFEAVFPRCLLVEALHFAVLSRLGREGARLHSPTPWIVTTLQNSDHKRTVFGRRPFHDTTIINYEVVRQGMASEMSCLDPRSEDTLITEVALKKHRLAVVCAPDGIQTGGTQAHDYKVYRQDKDNAKLFVLTPSGAPVSASNIGSWLSSDLKAYVEFKQRLSRDSQLKMLLELALSGVVQGVFGDDNGASESPAITGLLNWSFGEEFPSLRSFNYITALSVAAQFLDSTIDTLLRECQAPNTYTVSFKIQDGEPAVEVVVGFVLQEGQPAPLPVLPPHLLSCT